MWVPVTYRCASSVVNGFWVWVSGLSGALFCRADHPHKTLNNTNTENTMVGTPVLYKQKANRKTEATVHNNSIRQNKSLRSWWLRELYRVWHGATYDRAERQIAVSQPDDGQSTIWDYSAQK